MTLYIFKKMLSSSIRKLSIFCFLLFTVALHSQQGHGPFDKIQLNPNFAEEMQRTTTFKSEKHQPDFERIEHIRLLLKALLRGVLFTNRFITKNENTLQNKNQDPGSE